MSKTIQNMGENESHRLIDYLMQASTRRDDSIFSASSNVSLIFAKTVIGVSMPLQCHGNEYDYLLVIFLFSTKNT